MINKKLLLVSFFLLIGYFFVSQMINNKSYFGIKSLFSNEIKYKIKKTLYPHKILKEQEVALRKQRETIKSLEKYIFSYELKTKEIGENIFIKKSKTNILPNMVINKFTLLNGFYFGIHELVPGSGFIDFHEENLILLSSRGILAYSNRNLFNQKNLTQIKNNIENFIGYDEFIKDRWFSIKDLHIYNNKIFLSYTEQVKDNCWNTSVIYGDFNLQEINFKKLFSPSNCIHSKNNPDKEFNAHQSGGRIVSIDNDHILLSTGEYRNRYLAQDENKVNGKILKININNSQYKIISMGHRNPQGLYYDKENNFILSTEHGPQGGDEINLIDIKKISKKNFLNFGWPIVSEGEHYGGKSTDTKNKYKKYPLKKPHSKFGYIEPLKSFVPSIGISEISKISKNKYVVSSLKEQSIYFFELNENKKIKNIKKIKINERIRDLIYNQGNLYMFLENTGSIGLISLK